MSTKNVKYGVEEMEREFGRLSFGEILESHRLCEELSLKEMAELLGISISSVCDLEKGRRLPSLKRAQTIARKLGFVEELWVQAVIEDLLERENLNYSVKIAKAS